MADKSIAELVAASSVGALDLFVLEQGGTAKKLTGQILENWLLEMADGHGGIQNITKTSTSGLVDTYTITLADETTKTFTVTNAKSITSIAKVSSSGTNPVVDKYRITYNDGTTFDFNVTNGVKGDTGAAWYMWIKWASVQPTKDSDMGNTPDNYIGIYSGTSSTAPTHYTSYTWYKYKGETGTGITSISKTRTVGLVDTYTITFSNGTTSTFTVTNAKSISSVTKTRTSGLTDTYTITFNDGTSSTFDIVNGAPASISSTEVVYQAGTSGTVAPSGTWTPTIPTVPQGQFLWTRITINFNTGSPIIFHSVARSGLDGSGSVSSVNGQSPDEYGNVTVTADYIAMSDNTSVQTEFDKTDLLKEEIFGTTQEINFNSAEQVSSIVHKKGGTAFRTDTFTYGTSTITEARTIPDVGTLTITTNLTTLVTTVTFTAA